MRNWFVWITVAFIAPIPFAIGFVIGLPLVLAALLGALLFGLVLLLVPVKQPNPNLGDAEKSAAVFIAHLPEQPGSGDQSTKAPRQAAL